MKIANNILANILIMILIASLLIVLTMIGLNMYTRHNQSIVVPDVKGLQVEEAASFLSKANLGYEVVDSVYKKGGKPGAILDQIPKASSQIKSGRKLYLTVQAIGQQMIAVPDLADYSQRQAVSLLEALGFTNIHIEEVTSEYKDLVLSVTYNNQSYKKDKKFPIDAVIRMQVGDGMVEPVEDSTAVSSGAVVPEVETEPTTEPAL